MFPPGVLFGIALTIVLLVLYYFLILKSFKFDIFAPVYIIFVALSIMVAIITARGLWSSEISQSSAISSIVGLSLITIVFLLGNYLISSIKVPVSSNIGQIQVERLPVGGLEQVIDEGFNCLETQRYEDAIRSFNLALDFSDSGELDLKIRTELAFAYQMSGDLQNAQKQLETALELAEDLNDNSAYEIRNSLTAIKK
jgi:tetratricopeptide (TPR) repeat protein